MKAHKINIVNTLQLIATVEKQEAYNEDVPMVNVATELVNQWFDDFFKPEEEWFKQLFSSDEWDVLLGFHQFYADRVDKLPNSYSELRDDYFWKEIIGKANWALDMLGWRNLNLSYEQQESTEPKG